MASWKLIDKHGMLALHHRQVDGFFQLSTKPLRKRPDHLADFHAGRIGKPDQGRSEFHSGFRCCCNQKLLFGKRCHNSLNRRTGQPNSYSNFAKAEASFFIFQGPQDTRRTAR